MYNKMLTVIILSYSEIIERSLKMVGIIRLEAVLQKWVDSTRFVWGLERETFARLQEDRLSKCVQNICDSSARNQSHVGRVRFPLRAEMHGRGHITDSCFIAFITSKIC